MSGFLIQIFFSFVDRFKAWRRAARAEVTRRMIMHKSSSTIQLEKPRRAATTFRGAATIFK